MKIMKKLRVYVDTSVIGGCYDYEFSIWSNGIFKDFKSGNFQAVISELTAVEIGNAPERVRTKYAELKEYSEYLTVSDECSQLADIYHKRKILTPKFYDDMMHIALATVANVDIVVSWNFKHIVHFDKIRQFNGVNLELGYSTLQIYSPREVTNYEE
jgi:predicted nucleic acid-binding protein